MKDPYATLGVDRKCDLDAIKKAYRKLALKEHPDRGGNEERFKEIAEAFSILSDPEKRADYDNEARMRAEMPPPGMGGSPRGPGRAQHAGFQGGFGGGGGAGVDPYETFRAFFHAAGLSPADLGGGFGGGFGGPAPAMRQQAAAASKPPLVSYALSLTLEELCAGCAKKLKVTRRRSGAPQTKLLEVAVKPGWKAGTKLTFQGEGDDNGPGTAAGDIQLTIAQKPHARFERVGDDLVAHTRVTLKDVISGRDVEIPHLVGPPLRAKLNEVELDHGRHCIRFPGRGMPNTKRGKPGDAILIVHIAIPKRLTAEQRSAICAALDSGA